MENKITKVNLKLNQKMKSIRISLENHKKAEKILAVANKKKIGRTVKIDQVLNIALDLLTEAHIKKLQEQSLSNENRKELLRQKWTEINGHVSREEFTGIMMTKEFFDFLNDSSAANLLPTCAL